MLVACGDRDTFQLASPQTTILYPVRAGEMARVVSGVGPYGVCSRAFHRAARRPVRRVARRPGVGPAGAAALIRRYGSLEALLKAGRFPKQAAELRLYKSIATMDRKAPLPKLPDQTPTWAKAAALARAWQLNALADRLDLLASGDKRRASG